MTDCYRIVQPYGRDKAREATIISERTIPADAFAEIDRIFAQMVRTGAPSDAVELIVVVEADRIIQRREAYWAGGSRWPMDRSASVKRRHVFDN